MERAWRRILSMIAIGRSTTASKAGATSSVQLSIIGTANGGAEIRDNVTIFQDYGFASETVPGCDYAVAFLAGDRGKGVAVASNDRRYRPTLIAGEMMIFDNKGRQIYLSAAGIVITANGAPVTVSGSEITINGNTQVNGDLTVTGDLTAG